MRLIQIWKVARCGCFGPLSVPMTGVASSNRNVRQCRRGIPATRQTDRPERHRQRSTALTRSMRAAERCCAAARAGSGVLGAWWVHIPEKLENSTKAKNAPRNGRKSAVPPNGPASRGRRKGSSTPAKFPQPSEGNCDARKRSGTGAGRSAAHRGGLATDLSQVASAAKPTVPLPGIIRHGARKGSTFQADLLANNKARGCS